MRQTVLKAKWSLSGTLSQQGTTQIAKVGFIRYEPCFPILSTLTLVAAGAQYLYFLDNLMDELKATDGDIYVIALGCNDVRYINGADAGPKDAPRI